MRNVRTDLALEAREIYQEENRQEIPGVKVDVDNQDPDIIITRVNIFSILGEKAMGKPQGNYITIEVPTMRERDPELEERVSQCLASEIKRLVNFNKKNFTTLVVGLGNWNVTPDALGPRVVSQLMVTRHLLQLVPDQVDERVNSVCAVAPGVLGITGIETGEIIKGIVEKVKPDLVIAIDALASRKTERISTTIQIADTGISPGSGIGNKRMGLNKESMGVPVLAIGVPLVVYASTISQDAVNLLIQEFSKQAKQGSPFFQMLQEMDQNQVDQLVSQVVSEHIGDLVVTPKEIDIIVEDVAKILADGINLGVHNGINLDEVAHFLH